MDKILTQMTTSITSFKANPKKELAASGDQPFCVLTNNKPAFYVLSPKAWDAIQEMIWDLENRDLILERIERAKDPNNLVAVSIEDLADGKPLRKKATE